MALFNEILTGRYNRFLQKLLQLKGPAPAPQLASEITPAFDVEDVPVELRVLNGTNLWVWGITVPQVAAQTSALQFRNPTGSGMVAVLEHIILSSNTTQLYTIGWQGNNPADLANSGAAVRRDIRIQSGLSAMKLSSANNVAGLTLDVGEMQVLASTPYTLFSDKHHQFPLLPSCALRILGSANASISLMAMWRERAIEDSEVSA